MFECDKSISLSRLSVLTASATTTTAATTATATAKMADTAQHMEEEEEAFGTFPMMEPTWTTTAPTAATSSTMHKNSRYMVVKPASSITEGRIHPWGPEAQGLQEEEEEVATLAGETTSMHTDSTSSRVLNAKRFFYQSASQRNLAKRVTTPTTTTTIASSTSRMSQVFRLDQETIVDDFRTSTIRQGIEKARLHHAHTTWKTPYEVDAPRAIMLPRDHGIFQESTSTSSSSTMSQNRMTDPATVEARIWKGIDKLMADTFSSDEESVVAMTDILPQALVRAMSQRSLLSTTLSSQEVLDEQEQLDELEMAQAALHSFMDMILPVRSSDNNSNNTSKDMEESSLPTLSSYSKAPSDDDDDDDGEGYYEEDDGNDEIALAEVALNNFMNVLLQEVSYDNTLLKNPRQKQSAMQLLDVFQWTVRVNVDAQERSRFMEQERTKSAALEKEITEKIRWQQEEIKLLKQQEEEEISRLKEDEERQRKQLEQEETQRRLEQKEAMIMAQLEEQESALQQKVKELKATFSRFKVGATPPLAANRMQSPADRRRARRMEMNATDTPSSSEKQQLMVLTNRQMQDVEQVEELRAKIAETKFMLIEKKQELAMDSPVAKKMKRKKKTIPIESPAPPPTATAGKKVLASEQQEASLPLARIPKQFSSATIPSKPDNDDDDNRIKDIDESHGSMAMSHWLNPVPVKNEIASQDGSIEANTLPNFHATKHPFTSSSSSSNRQSKSSEEIDRRKSATNSTSPSENSYKSVHSKLPSTSTSDLFFTYPSEASIDPSNFPNLAADRVARNSGTKSDHKPTPLWAAIGGRPLVMSTSPESHSSEDHAGGSVKSNLLPSSFHESENVHGFSGSTESSPTLSMVKSITPTVVTTTPVVTNRSRNRKGEQVEEIPDLKSISEGSMSESSSTESSRSSDSSDSTSGSTSSDSSSSSSSEVPSNSASTSPSYIVEERVEHTEGSRGPTPDHALVFSDSFVKKKPLLPSSLESESESETDSLKEFPRFFRTPSQSKVGVLSEAGNVFTDDVSQYSFDHIAALGIDPVPEGDLSQRKIRPGAEFVRQLSQHTSVCSVDTAGDIHMGATVRFGSMMDWSDDSSSSVADDVTLDSELQADDRRYDGFRRVVPKIKKRQRSIGGCIRSSIKAMRERGLCVTSAWGCCDKKEAMKRRPSLEKELSSRRCLLHLEEATYDRSHVLSDTPYQRRETQSLVDIDEDGFMVS